MAELRLTYQELKRYSSTLTREQFEAGIENIGLNQTQSPSQLRWELMGHHIILAKLKLYCLQELHITLAGYDAISDTSLVDLYQSLYRRLVGQLPRMTTSQPELQRQRVDRLLGFIRFVHPGLLSQFITPEVLKSTVRRLLPADEMLRRYVKKNGGIMQRTVTPTAEGSHVRLIYRLKDAVRTGRTLNEAVAMASERMADILYDGDLPTVHEAFPQQTRTTIALNSNMRVWGQAFDVSDDIIGRILGFDQANQSMDRLIESIGSNLSAIYYFNHDLKLTDHQEAGKRVVQYVDHVADRNKIVAAPFMIPLGQAHPVIKHALVFRMFFYLNPLGTPINPEFAKLLQTDQLSRVVSSRSAEATKSKIKSDERIVTSVFKPAEPKPVSFQPVEPRKDPSTPASMPANRSHSEQSVKPFEHVPAQSTVKTNIGNDHSWRRLNGFGEMIEWVEKAQQPYTTLLSNTQNPIWMFQELLKPDHPTTLTLVIPQLDRQKLKVVAPLIKKVMAIPSSQVMLYVANAGHVMEEQPVGDISAMTILALLKRGVKLRQMDAKQSQSQMIELVSGQMVIDFLVVGDLTMVGTASQVLPGQVTVTTLDHQPFGWWLEQLAQNYQDVSASKLTNVLLDDRLKNLGF